ncbi:phosphate acetyltransferase [Cocleimonas sp. KMM 6892]|uniref:phosphate acetyltransferase n=1 Tax=unclassified Cocleimonas TaxID=2639732 RepID=UPI002DB751C1|nr:MULTISPECIES: phosphate acetyltransferase [unclassified Cocleimonas]MEB8431950.1 phosphate acetyltransferase [Cocleimonas sp. KMM 6892]MEC4714964.1 phosphate acetyltransferase [Cocleimonas sp. KMM 6895]MEC4744222.1 phosphate acetyltransferase [Cocleimonas sp. KMM 6896]
MNPDFITLAQQSPKRIVLPESSDDRILQAAVAADQQGIAKITLLGDPAVINTQLEKLNLSLGNITIVHPETSDNNYATNLFKLREKKGMTQTQADKISLQPLYFGDLMVQAGDADACVAGVINSTGNVIRAALHVLGTETPTTRLSSFFIMLLEAPLESPVLFADCAINIDPDAEILADIAIQSAKNAKKLLGMDPKIAMLSFSTNGSAKHISVDKVREATDLVKEQAPELNIIGEIQLDAAMSKRVLATKWPDSDFQAPANIFVFPSLEAGNIGYKIAERFGNATAVGPILQGLAKPVNDLSRGADVEAIINTIAVTCLQCE